ncbi:hypothetical protein V8G54_026704 [Vigna mungo]|uniref:Uncharacterized protein n=1 Tax=Vigna mungo TaxID=3915 RepID=A0AAQ3N1B1_VIGMU
MDKEVELGSLEDEVSSQQIPQTQRRKGGLVTMPFIIANEALASMASLGLLPNMIQYLMGSYKLHLAKATQILLLSSATSNFTPVVGAFVADSYLGRFLAVALAMIPQARPPPCSHDSEGCKSATGGQMTMLISALALMSIGKGGLACSLAFGADQVNRKDNPNNRRVLEKFFSWYYAFAAISIIIGFTVIVYIQDNVGWKVGYGVPAALMLLSTIFFLLASPLYVKNKVKSSLLTGFAQVITVAYKNRKLSLPPTNSPELYHHKKDSDLVVPTDKLSFLNKACVIKNPELDIASDGSASNPWRLCTVDQVEELKAIIRVVPLWSTGIMMSVSIGGSFGLLQAKSLNRHITSHFQVPPGSFSVILVLSIFVWIALYDRVILPVASKIRGKPVRINAKRRMGVGLLFSFIHLVVSAIVETTRRKRAIEEGYLNNGHAVLHMSAMWLFPQLILGGIAEAFNAIGQNEFYYTEFPKSMSSVATSLSGLGMAAGNLVSSFVFSVIENVTSSGGKEGWILDNINKGRYDKYYWVISGLSALNIVYYLLCSWAYGPTVDELREVGEENGSSSMEEEASTELRNGAEFHKDFNNNMEKEMEVGTEEQMNPDVERRKGGFITMPFIIGNEALAKMASVGLIPNMIVYLMGDYRIGAVKATKILFFWFAATNFAPVLAAFLADAYFGRFLSIGLEARPCSYSSENCKSATTLQMAILLSCFALISIGGGGISCSLAFGADQLKQKTKPNNQRVLESFISWYIASQTIAVVFALTGIVYIQDHFGWKLGFGLPAALMLFSTFSFFLISPRYLKHKPNSTLITGFAQVIFVAYKNRNLSFPPKNSTANAVYHHDKDSILIAPTDKLRFLNKACIVRDRERDIASDGSASKKWSLCTVEQVEELKAIIKVIPIWSTGIMVAVSTSQTSLWLLQAKTMNRHVTSNFQIPAGSFGVFMMLAVCITAGVYDRVILPLASKVRGKPVTISAKKRIGIGLFFSFLDFVTSAIVESIRRRKAIREGFADNPEAVLEMSAMWLIPHNILCGIAEAFNAIGQSEFYYSEFPSSMSSIAASLFSLGSAVGNLVASLILSIVDNITSKGGKQSWISDNINKGHYDKYYWLLSILSAVNILYYLVCSWAYGPSAEAVSKKEERRNRVRDQQQEAME